MFYQIVFDDLESEVVKDATYNQPARSAVVDLQHHLAGYPNGTIIDRGMFINIHSHPPPKQKWFVWFEDEIFTRKENQDLLEVFPSTPGVKSFTRMDIAITPRDAEWKWEDSYLMELFREYL